MSRRSDPGPAPAPALSLFGLGPRPEDDVTVETLMEMESCRLLFCVLRGRRDLAWLRRHFPRAALCRGASEVVAEAARAPGVGLAVWGHPLFTSAVAREARALALRRGLTCRVFAANSPLGAALARTKTFLGGAEGWAGAQALELEEALARPQTLVRRHPLVVHAEAADAALWRRLGRAVAGLYDESHPVHYQSRRSRLETATVGRARWEDVDGFLLLPAAVSRPARWTVAL